MDGTDAEGLLRNLDRRVGRIEQILPTLVTAEKFQATVGGLVTTERFDSEVAKLATKEELRAEVAKLATKEELRAEVAKLATKEDLRETADGLRTDLLKAMEDNREFARQEVERCCHHMDVRTEKVLDQFKKVLDGQKALREDHEGLRIRVEKVEGAQVRLEDRVTVLETGRVKPGPKRKRGT
jgi:hypothetical protein